MYWVVQDNIYSESGYDALIQALERMSLPYSVHKFRQFIWTLEPEANPPPGKVIVMGSYSLIKIAKERGWEPGAFVSDNLDYEIQLQHWGNALLNADASIHKLLDVPERHEPFFIRPVTDSKEFAGRVMNWNAFVRWRSSVTSEAPENGGAVPPDLRVMVCSQKRVIQECRLWIVKQRVVTSSVYKSGTWKYYDARVDQRFTEFGEEMAQKWSPLPAYVLDVADTDDGLKIVEVNNLNSAGFYAADMNKLVGTLEENFG